MLLDQDPGPSNVLAGLMPADYGERDGSQFWLIQGPTFIYAARCHTVDVARALVLDKLGYGGRAELADNLSARPATRREVNAVVARTRRRALTITKKNGRRLVPIMVALYRADVRASGDMRDGGTIGDLP
jgi:hypothetical protein